MAYAMNEVVDSVLQAFQERLAAVETDLTDLREEVAALRNEVTASRRDDGTLRMARAVIERRLDRIERRMKLRGHSTEIASPQMLADKDRIFTNLYGLHDWGLKGRNGARAVGRHQAAPRERSRLDHRGDQGLRAAWTRRRGLPDRAQVVVHAEAVATGGRATSSSMPTSPSPAPARTARSCATTRIRWSKAASLPASRWAPTRPSSTSAASSSASASGSRRPLTRLMTRG